MAVFPLLQYTTQSVLHDILDRLLFRGLKCALQIVEHLVKMPRQRSYLHRDTLFKFFQLVEVTRSLNCCKQSFQIFSPLPQCSLQR